MHSNWLPFSTPPPLQFYSPLTCWGLIKWETLILKASVIIACHYTAALKITLWQYPGFVAALCCRFGKHLCGMQQHAAVVLWHGPEMLWEAAGSTGLPPRAEVATAQAPLSQKATEQRRVGSELSTSISEELRLQLGCSCIFPFTLPKQIYT